MEYNYLALKVEKHCIKKIIKAKAKEFDHIKDPTEKRLLNDEIKTYINIYHTIKSQLEFLLSCPELLDHDIL